MEKRAGVEALLAFSSYDLNFFNELCMELTIEMPAEILLKRGPTPLVLRMAIAPLILAFMRIFMVQYIRLFLR
jgi:hypothetical protein